ncbi:MAG: arginine--tRNA ligase [Chitinispirillaceae bacterium]|nr:arginine--tRNA ligase [Chitinispirillaceae bacterium]
MKEYLAGRIAGHLKTRLSPKDIERMLETPPQESLGDFAFPCFPLARSLRKNPAVIAGEIRQALAGDPAIERIEVVSGYCNFFLNRQALARKTLDLTADESFGRPSVSRRVVVEFASPNSNKPLHLGHLRNLSIGESVARILAFCGNSVVRTSINNDRGVHICKSMLAYAELGKGTTPQKEGRKSDHFVGDYYVLFSRKAAEDEAWNERAQEMLRKWEAHDSPTVELWKTMNTWAFEGFAATYRLFGIAFDKEYFESEIYKSGKEIILDGLEKGIFKKREDGAVIADLSEENMGDKVLLRPDGTSVYIVQDLYLAVLKDREFPYDLSLYVVGNEQEYHFAVLKALFTKLGYPLAGRIAHLSYGMVELPEGKMKSREGTVVDADDLISDTQELAKTEVRERYAISPEAIDERSLKIALAAIKYQLLRVDIAKNMVFDPKKAIAFEGDTGPYLLYSYARASSILRKAGTMPVPEIGTLEPGEIRLLKKLGGFPDALQGAYEKFSPSLIAAYGFELAQAFNEFYHSCPVIGSDTAGFRLALVERFRTVLKRCLWLLGIEEIEEM